MNLIFRFDCPRWFLSQWWVFCFLSQYFPRGSPWWPCWSKYLFSSLSRVQFPVCSQKSASLRLVAWLLHVFDPFKIWQKLFLQSVPFDLAAAVTLSCTNNQTIWSSIWMELYVSFNHPFPQTQGSQPSESSLLLLEWCWQVSSSVKQ